MNPNGNERLFIGIMSGTSVDALDAALVSIDEHKLELVATTSHLFSASMRQRIIDLFEPGQNEIDRVGALDRELAEISAECVANLLQQEQLKPKDICAIGSHGQTIRHRPPSPGLSWPFTMQICDPNTIAARTGITTIADFRRKDLALGGQGAPLAPAFHAFLCSNISTEPCAVLNIGGIANLSIIEPQANNSKVSGFDTGPGNGLMDAWIQQHKGESFDRDGSWASSGKPQQALLETLLTQPFFQASPPKSTGKEEFNLSWLTAVLAQTSFRTISAEDVQATLLELSSQSIADAVLAYGRIEKIYLCGGGALNKELVRNLRTKLPQTQLLSSSELGIAPTWVEAAAFAWLAQQCLDGLPGNRIEVTGATREAILGGVYFP